MDAPLPVSHSGNGGLDPATDPFALAPEEDPYLSLPTGDSLSWEPLLAYRRSNEPSGESLAPTSDAATAKIREILFGEHMAEYERRFAQLEVRMARELKEVRQDALSRFESFRSRIGHDIENLGHQLDYERSERTKEVAHLGDQHRAMRHELEEAVDKSRHAEAAVLHLRHALQEETARQRRALEERADAIERRLDSVAASLGKEKVDRSSLQVLFEQLSVHFGSDTPRPGITSRLDGQG